MDALSPNTAAFLDSLTTNLDSSNLTSLPPSAFFKVPAHVPGRDTPEESPISSSDNMDKPTRVDLSDDSSPEPPLKSTAESTTQHKRKAGQAQVEHETADEDEDDDHDSDKAPSRHEDKRQHADKSRHMSTEKDQVSKRDPSTKAQRRKEQNRAAQKAFRERREAKVKDLEDKVAELEAKSFGVTVENENLRGILRRLQEENMALKQAAFTFSMPTPVKSPNSPTEQAKQPQSQPQVQQLNTAPIQAQAQSSFVVKQPQQISPPGIDWSMFSRFKQPQPQIGKPPSPPQSVSDVSNSSQNNGVHPSLTHRSSSSSNMLNDNSPESLVSLNSVGDNQRSLFDPVNAPYAGFQNEGDNRFNPSFLVTRDGVSPNSNSTTSTNSTDTEAFFRNFLNGPNRPVPQITNQQQPQSQTQQSQQLSQQQQQQQQQQVQAQPQQRELEDMLAMFTAPTPNSNQIGPYTFLASPGLVSSADSSSNISKLLGDRTSYRETTSNPAQTVLPSSNGKNTTSAPSPSWADLADSSVSDFLASLTGPSTDANTTGLDPADDAFEQQLQAILAGSSGSNAMFSNNVFSPSNYLNISPSPLDSISPSNSVPSASNSANSASNSNHTSPESNSQPASRQASENLASGDQLGSGVGSVGPPKYESEIVHVLAPNGEVMRPSEVWMKMGVQHEEDPRDLMVDDLCDMMKEKATCKDGRKFVTYEEVENMVKFRGKDEISATVARNRALGVPPHLALMNASFDILSNRPCPDASKDPQACQAAMNNLYMLKNSAANQQ